MRGAQNNNGGQAMSFKSHDRAFSEKAEKIVLRVVGAISLIALGALLHSVWVLRP